MIINSEKEPCIFFNLLYYLCVCAVFEIKLRAVRMIGRYYITELHPPKLFSK